MKISGVVICKNEERNIKRCLSSLASVCDEIIVVDSGSSDHTPEICKSFDKVKFFDHPWMGYGQQKNYANQLAQGPYILSLDADEELSDELVKEIHQLKQNLSGVYALNRLTNYCGTWIHHSDWFPDFQKRLFPKDHCRWSESDVHETLLPDESLEIKKLQALAHHYSFHTIEDHINTINKYSALGAQEVLKKNKKFLVASFFINGTLRFFKAYFLKGGFRDGFHGFVVCALSGFAVGLKYLKAANLKYKR